MPLAPAAESTVWRAAPPAARAASCAGDRSDMPFEAIASVGNHDATTGAAAAEPNAPGLSGRCAARVHRVRRRRRGEGAQARE